MDTDLHQIIRSNQALSEEHCQVQYKIPVNLRIRRVTLSLINENVEFWENPGYLLIFVILHIAYIILVFSKQC